MGRYNEHDFVRALVPLLIARLPAPFSPTEADMWRIAEVAGRWSELLVALRTDREWAHFLLDYDGPTWNEPDDRNG